MSSGPWSRTPIMLGLLALASATLSPVLEAQTTPLPETSYCYAGRCYANKFQAEGDMRASNPLYGAYLKPKDPKLSPSTNQLDNHTYTYYVPDQKPLHTNPPVFTFDPVTNPAPQFCNPSGDPTYPKACANEAEMVGKLIESEKAIYGATTETHSYSGSYAMPFSITHAATGPGTTPYGWMRHNWDNNRSPFYTLLVTYNKPGWAYPKFGTYQLRKFTSFTCAEGFTARSGSHPDYDPNAINLMTEPACGAHIGELTITTKLLQTCSVPPPGVPPTEGTRPCFPATGDKARFEEDFDFSGRPFVRSYHSLRQAGQLPELAPGWVHSYSDRLIGDPSSERLTLVSDTGYLTRMDRIANSTRFVSLVDANLVIETSVENGQSFFTLKDGSNLVRRYNSGGRLLRVNSLDTAWQIDFAYVGDRLISATDYLGKKLTFEYLDNRLSAIRLPDGNTVNYEYDIDGNFQTVRYADQKTRTYHYNESGLSDAHDPHALTGISDNGTRYLSFGYDGSNRVRLSQVQSSGVPVEKTELIYSGDSQVSVVGHRGEVRTYTLSSLGGARRITAMTAMDGNISTTYAGALLMESRDKAQHVTRFEYTADKSYLSGRIEGFGSDDERRTVVVRDPSTYRLMSREIQAKSGSTYVAKQRQTFTYNVRGQQLTATVSDPASGASRTVSTSYCEQTDVNAGTCPLVGLVKSIDGALSGSSDTTTYTYRMADAPECAAAPTTCAYRKGNLWKITNALGRVTETLAYDGTGRVLKVKDANGVTTDQEYDARGRLLSRKVRGTNNAVETDDQITRLDYLPTGEIRQVTQPDGSYVVYSYDDARRLATITDNAGNRIVYALNAASERVGEDTFDAQGDLRRTLSRNYNLLGQLESLQLPNPDPDNTTPVETRFKYDRNGNPDTTTDALERVTDNDHDALDRLSRSLQDKNGIAAETKFSYDVLDNLTRVRDPKGLPTNYYFNGLGDMMQLDSPDTGITGYLYDGAGNRTRRTDARDVVTNYGYDALNRLKTVTYPTAALNTSFTYDTTQAACVSGETFSIGKLTKMVDGSGNTVYCYDRFGNLVRKVQTTAGKSFAVRYLYAPSGRMTGMIYPNGTVADYVYDAQGRVKEIGVKPSGGQRVVLLGGASYHPFGPVALWTYGNNRVMSRTANKNYQPENVAVAAAGGIGINYRFDEVGNLKRLRSAVLAEPPRRQYGYDGLNRLIEVRDGANLDYLEGYAYDKTGNRISASQRREIPAGPGGGSGAFEVVTTDYAYPANNHRLTAVGGEERAYDAAGNLTRVGELNRPGGNGGPRKLFAYDDQARMSGMQGASGIATAYLYSGRGEQVRKSVTLNGTATGGEFRIFDESGRWLGAYDNNGSAIQQVVWLGDIPVGLLMPQGPNDKLYYIEADALGSPRVVVDPARGPEGTAVWTWDLAGQAFGNLAPNEDPDGDAIAFRLDMRFPGQRYDGETGLNYNYFRDYDATTGRYVESDPIGLRGGISGYGYVADNPLTRYDPKGLKMFCSRVQKTTAEWFPDRGYVSIPYEGFVCVDLPDPDETKCILGCDQSLNACMFQLDIQPELTFIPCVAAPGLWSSLCGAGTLGITTLGTDEKRTRQACAYAHTRCANSCSGPCKGQGHL